MIDGDPDKRQYRRYRIKSVQVGNDFAAMYEVVSRRLRRAAKSSELPDLFVIDGGKGQLSSALAAVKDAGVSGVDVIALAKERKPTLRDALNAKVTQLPERVFVPNRRDPVILPSNSPEMHMLARIRDEAHRFAIGYQRQLMRKARVRSQLETIPGIGASRRKALLRHFGSLERIRGASVDELAQVAGMGELLARHLYARLHAKETAHDPAFYLEDH
jgi:excinuclease ABC subunit C